MKRDSTWARPEAPKSNRINWETATQNTGIQLEDSNLQTC